MSIRLVMRLEAHIPFVLPKALIISFIIHPVRVHVIKKVGFADPSNCVAKPSIFSSRVAVGLIRMCHDSCPTITLDGP